MRSLLFLILLSSLLKTHGQELQFKNVTIPDLPKGSRGVSIADLDANGLNDIVVANQVDSTQLLGNTIYFNHKDGYKKVALAKDKVNAWSESVHTVDVDNDYDLDIFFTTQFGAPNLLYLNDGKGEFTAAEAGDLTTDLTNSPGAYWCDMDLDGDLDVFVVNRDGADDQLYLNDGKGRFTRSLTGPWIGNGGDGRSCVWGDLNGDATPDVYIANGTEGYPEIQNFLFLGIADHSFKRVYNALSPIEGHISAGTASGDFDNDGDLDFYVCNWGADVEANDCYLNQHQGNNWVKLQLRGTTSNSYGIGSWIKLTLGHGTMQTRYLSRGTGYGSENSPEIHFGIGTATKISSIEIQWPTGKKQTASDIAPNAVYQFLEGKEFKRMGI